VLISVTAELAIIQLDINRASGSTLTDELDLSPRLLVIHSRSTAYFNEFRPKERQPENAVELERKSPLVDAVWNFNAPSDSDSTVEKQPDLRTVREIFSICREFRILGSDARCEKHRNLRQRNSPGCWTPPPRVIIANDEDMLKVLWQRTARLTPSGLSFFVVGKDEVYQRPRQILPVLSLTPRVREVDLNPE
jgi:hypothetical protein